MAVEHDAKALSGTTTRVVGRIVLWAAYGLAAGIFAGLVLSLMLIGMDSKTLTTVVFWVCCAAGVVGGIALGSRRYP